MEQLAVGGRKAASRADFQRKYLKRMRDILRRWRIECTATVSARSGAVKLAADLSLAVTAKGRNSWSRAILAKYIFGLKKSRYKPGVIKSHAKRRSASYKIRQRRKSVRLLLGAPSRARNTSLRSCQNCEEETGGAVASRMETLRLLVRGSHRLDTPVLLKEAADYTVALEMQVQAMQTLVDCYSYSRTNDAFQV